MTSIEYGKKAYQLNPNDPRILWGYGTVLALSGQGQDALEFLLKAHELSPHIGIEGSVDVLISSVLLGYFASGNNVECITWFKKLAQKDFRSYVLYAYSLKNTLMLEQDSEFIDEFRVKFKDFDFNREIDLFRFKDLGILEKLKNMCKELLI